MATSGFAKKDEVVEKNLFFNMWNVAFEHVIIAQVSLNFFTFSKVNK